MHPIVEDLPLLLLLLLLLPLLLLLLPLNHRASHASSLAYTPRLSRLSPMECTIPGVSASESWPFHVLMNNLPYSPVITPHFSLCNRSSEELFSSGIINFSRKWIPELNNLFHPLI